MIKRIKKDKVTVTSGMIFPANATYEFILFHRPKVRHCPLDKGPILWSRVPRTFTWNLTSSNPGSARLHIRQNSGRQEKSSFKTGHSMRTHFPFEFSRLRWARQVVYMRESCPTCQGYFTCRGETTRPLPLLPFPPSLILRRVHNFM